MGGRTMIGRTLTCAALAVLVSSTPLVAQPSFRKYVAVGDSLTAGLPVLGAIPATGRKK